MFSRSSQTFRNTQAMGANLKIKRPDAIQILMVIIFALKGRIADFPGAQNPVDEQRNRGVEYLLHYNGKRGNRKVSRS